MDRGRSVAYKRSWRENFVGRAAQRPLSTTQPFFLCSSMRKRDNQERRFHDVDSIAYFRSKLSSQWGEAQRIYGRYRSIHGKTYLPNVEVRIGMRLCQ